MCRSLQQRSMFFGIYRFFCSCARESGIRLVLDEREWGRWGVRDGLQDYWKRPRVKYRVVLPHFEYTQSMYICFFFSLCVFGTARTYVWRTIRSNSGHCQPPTHTRAGSYCHAATVPCDSQLTTFCLGHHSVPYPNPTAAVVAFALRVIQSMRSNNTVIRRRFIATSSECPWLISYEVSTVGLSSVIAGVPGTLVGYPSAY